MTDEYIRKQDAADAIKKRFGCNAVFSIIAESVIDELKPADVVPVVHGKWIGYDDTERFTAQCGLCGNVIDTRFGSNFCPNCGVKMDGGDEHG